MGCFSWLRADNLTRYGNIYENGLFKCLIPKEFGGGFIKDRYRDYGYLGQKADGSPKYDMYELLAIWNHAQEIPFARKTVGECLKGVDFSHPMKEIDEYTDKNCLLGIKISANDNQIAILKYPLKLVSASYRGSYEDCEGRSYNDPERGTRRTRAYYEKWYVETKEGLVPLNDVSSVNG